MPGDREAAALRTLIDDLARQNVRMRVERGALRCTAPNGVLTAELQQRIRSHKPDLVGWLTEQALVPLADRTGPIPLAPVQEQIWLATHLGADPSAYNIPLAVRLTGTASPAALSAALAETVRRHEVLRTTLPVRDGRPEQRVLPYTAQPLPMVDLTGIPRTRRDAVTTDLAVAEAQLPFDLAAGPAVRATLLRRGWDDHRLLLTRHHTTSDGWSFGVLAAELAAHYTAAKAGLPGALPVLPRQFVDVAVWQRASVGDTPLRRIEEWADRLVGAHSGLHRAPAAATDLLPPATAPATVEELVPPDVSESIRRLATRLRTTPFAVLLASVGLALGERVASSRVVVGVAVAGRTRPEFESMIGCFAAVLPVPLTVEPTASFARTAAQAQAAVAIAVDDHAVPLDRVASRLRSKDPHSGRTLFSVAFAFQNAPEPDLTLPGIDVRIDPPVPTGPAYPLLLTVPAARDYRVVAEYDARIIDGSSVALLLGRTREILGRAVTDPERAPLGGPTGRASAVPETARRAPSAGPPRSLAVLALEATTGRRDAIAVVDGVDQLTAGALHGRATALAEELRAAGVGPETPVGVCVGHTVHLPVALLAVAYAGGFAVPVDPEDPPARQEVVLTGVAVAALVTDGSLHRQLTWFTGPILLADAAVAWRRLRTPGAVHPDSTAYAVHTSGSTGVPRAVAVSQRNITALFAATAGRLGLGEHDTWSAVHSSAFDFSVWEIWGCMVTGGRLVVVPRETTRDPQAWADVLLDEQVTVLSATPGAFEPLSAALLDRGGPGATRLVVLGGERLDPRRLGRWFAAPRAHPTRVVNMYGITETTVHVTARNITSSDVAGAISPIGYALDGMALHVVDRQGDRAASGEFLVGGTGVALGYRGRPGATADRFRPDHLEGGPGSRLYRSGDLGRVLPDGGIAYQGRADSQLSVRGHRVEPAEIESAICAHPDVVAAGVALDLAPAHPRLLGFLVVGSDGPPTLRGIRRHLADRLPAHLVPHRLLLVERLPLTRNGKLDRAALPTLAGVPLDARHDPPTSETELVLAALWCELLGLSDVGVHEDFFECGGDSLLVTRLHARVTERFGVELPMRRLYRALDIAAQAAVVDALHRHPVRPVGEPVSGT